MTFDKRDKKDKKKASLDKLNQDIVAVYKSSGTGISSGENLLKIPEYIKADSPRQNILPVGNFKKRQS